MEKFKTIITTKNKVLPYDFLDQLGIPEKIEEFYDFLAARKKDDLIVLAGDTLKINKTKIMGGLMLGDNTILERLTTEFRSWLLKIV